MIDLLDKFEGREGFCTAVEAMITGLKNQNDRADFTVFMGSYGEASCELANGKKICFGCAATCAIQEYTGVNFDGNSIPNEYARARAIDADVDILRDFEIAIEWLRCGEPYKLCNFCELVGDEHRSVNSRFDGLPQLVSTTATCRPSSEDWEFCLPEYETALDDLKSEWGLVATGS